MRFRYARHEKWIEKTRIRGVEYKSLYSFSGYNRKETIVTERGKTKGIEKH